VLGCLIDTLCWTLAGQQLHGSLDVLQLLNGQAGVLNEKAGGGMGVSERGSREI